MSATATAAAVDVRPMQRLAVDDLVATVVRPLVSPLMTAMALIGACLSDAHRMQAPHEVRRQLLAHLRQRDLQALLPLRSLVSADGSGGRPNAIVPVVPGSSFADELSAVRELDRDVIARSVAAASAGGAPTRDWRIAVGDARWPLRYVDALRRAWEHVLQGVWSGAAALLDRDVERTSVALARGAVPELLAQLVPCAEAAGGDLLLPSHSARPGRLRVGGSLLLLPLVAPAPCGGWADDDGDVCLALRHAVPGAWRVLDREPPAPASLAALLGPQRAKILHLLERPAMAGELAALLHGGPSMVTHHLRALEQAGLISRTREGRHVRVRRSARGTALTAIYERP